MLIAAARDKGDTGKGGQGRKGKGEASKGVMARARVGYCQQLVDVDGGNSSCR